MAAIANSHIPSNLPKPPPRKSFRSTTTANTNTKTQSPHRISLALRPSPPRGSRSQNATNSYCPRISRPPNYVPPPPPPRPPRATTAPLVSPLLKMKRNSLPAESNAFKASLSLNYEQRRHLSNDSGLRVRSLSPIVRRKRRSATDWDGKNGVTQPPTSIRSKSSQCRSHSIPHLDRPNFLRSKSDTPEHPVQVHSQLPQPRTIGMTPFTRLSCRPSEGLPPLEEQLELTDLPPSLEFMSPRRSSQRIFQANKSPTIPSKKKRFKTLPKGFKTNSALLLEKNHAATFDFETRDRRDTGLIAKRIRRKKVEVGAAREKTESELTILKAQKANAVAAQNFELCLQLQPKINKLQKLLASLQQATSASADPSSSQQKQQEQVQVQQQEEQVPSLDRPVTSRQTSIDQLSSLQREIKELKDQKRRAMYDEEYDRCVEISNEIEVKQNIVGRLKLSLQDPKLQSAGTAEIKAKIDALEHQREEASEATEYQTCIELSKEIELLQSQLSELPSQHRRSMTWVEAILKLNPAAPTRTARSPHSGTMGNTRTKTKRRNLSVLQPAEESRGLTKARAGILCMTYFNSKLDNQLSKEMHKILDIVRNSRTIVTVTFLWKNLQTEKIDLGRALFYLWDITGTGDWKVVKTTRSNSKSPVQTSHYPWDTNAAILKRKIKKEI